MILSLLFAGFALAQPPAPEPAPMPPIGQRTTAPEQLLGTISTQDPVAEEEAMAAAAARFPLGTVDNPVRVGGPEGERAYLARLRCPDGSNPAIGGRSGRGVGGFGTVVGAYSVQCSGAPAVEVVLDMYHEEHREDRAPPGLTLAAE